MPTYIRQRYLDDLRIRYRNSDKRTKGKILDGFCELNGYTRKHAIRLLKGRLEPRRRPGPLKKYDKATSSLRELWELMGRIYSKKMKAAMPIWLKYYKPPKEIREMLLKMSPSTIDRLLRSHRAPPQCLKTQRFCQPHSL